jgi:hypothetical protein
MSSLPENGGIDDVARTVNIATRHLNQFHVRFFRAVLSELLRYICLTPGGTGLRQRTFRDYKKEAKNDVFKIVIMLKSSSMST